MPSTYQPTRGHDEDEDGITAAESEALILHRLDTDPNSGRARVSTVPSGSRHYRDDDGSVAEGEDDDDDIEGQTDEMLEKRRIKALARQATESVQAKMNSDPKAGRPEWLLDAMGSFRRLPPLYRGGVIAAALFVLCGIFWLALGSDGASRAWHYGGDVWRGGTVPYVFPSDIGHPGPTATGLPAQLEEESRVTGVSPSAGLPIQTSLPGSPYGSFNPFNHMGPLTPYKSSDGFGVDDANYHALPASCKVEQVHMLHRHGARYPTSYSPVLDFEGLLNQKPRPTFTGPLSFLNKYEYQLGRELLVPLGRQQLYDSGVASAIRYGRLIYDDIAKHSKLFSRAGSQHRIVDSGRNWLAGALGVNDWQEQSALEIQIEDVGFNTTMAPNFACKNAGAGKHKYEPGVDWNRQWIEKYAAGAAKRLSAHVQGAEITPRLVNGLQQLCSYDTVAGHDAHELCSLFTEQEWLDYEYAWDLEFWAVYGSGSPIGAGQGTGWVNEFLARLNGKPWDASRQTSENATLDSFPRTFPVDRSFYVDFSHDSVIANVLAALNLPDFAKVLPPLPPHADPKRTYKSSEIVPFGARLVFEKIQCSEGATDNTSVSSSTTLIRMLLNDAIVPLKQLKPCEDRPDGMCSLDRFLKSQEGIMGRAHWDRCFESD